MSEGLRRLIGEAKDEPLPFVVSMYCGQMIVTGRVAPPDWFFRLTREGLEKEVWDALKRVKNSEERKARYVEHAGPTSKALAAGEDGVSPDSVVDEVTLVDAQILPAVSRQGTKSGGHVLPVVRIPFSAIDMWWIMGGETIRGRGALIVGAGVLLPLGH